jgi:hypothetical protein
MAVEAGGGRQHRDFGSIARCFRVRHGQRQAAREKGTGSHGGEQAEPTTWTDRDTSTPAPPEHRRQVPRVWPTTPSPPRGADRGRRARRRRIGSYRQKRTTRTTDFAPARTLITGGIYARPDVMLASRPIFSITRARCLASNSIPAPTRSHARGTPTSSSIRNQNKQTKKD